MTNDLLHYLEKSGYKTEDADKIQTAYYKYGIDEAIRAFNTHSYNEELFEVIINYLIKSNEVDKGTIKYIQDRIDPLVEKVVHLNELKKKIKNQIIEICSHDFVLEGEYRSGGKYHDPYYGSPRHDPPFRVCKECGLAEEGWGCGYYKLNDREGRDIIQTKREVACKYIKKEFGQSELNRLKQKEMKNEEKSKTIN